MGRSVISQSLTIWFVLALGAAINATSAMAAARPAPTFAVGGWPIPDLDQPTPPTTLGDDPILGRQACPPIMRLDLTNDVSEPLLVRRVSKDAAGTEWRIDAKTDVYWWSGEPVSAQDLAVFVKDALPRAVNDRGLTMWPLPGFDVKAEGKSVVVRWSKPPRFGPFVLSGVPLARPATGGKDRLAYECAGLYRMTKTAPGVLLTPNPAYKMRLPTISVQRDVAKLPAKGHWMAIRAASTYGGTPWTRLSDDKPKCSMVMDLPSATVIAWNPKRGVTTDRALRALLTELTPRGELLRSGAAALGELISAPIPKQHPGYDARISVRPFNIHAISVDLNKLGYQRKDAYAPRLDKQGKPLRLTLVTPTDPGLAEKVVADTYSSLGISTAFKTVHETTSAEADGVFANVRLDWPRSDLIGTLHSRAKDSSPFYRLDDRQLDELLERYALSLTEAKPDFGALSAVHRRLFDLEPMTVLLQHKACVEVGGGLRLPAKGVNVLDPDWFRKIVL